MAGVGSSDQLMAEINVTPFVDVMLVLLIIFMVTAPMMVEGLNVNLPQATSEPLPSSEQEQHLVVSIDAGQEVYINDFKVSIDFLREKLFKVLETRTNRAVFIKADKDVPYGAVVRVLSEVKAAGVEKLGMLTVPLDGEKPKKR
ncbi:MAG: protein TolR [Pseudomonadota bacterium]